MTARMKAAVFDLSARIVLDEKPIPDIGRLDALIQVTTTTICGTDVHMFKSEFPVENGLARGHKPVGVIEKLGSADCGYLEGQRVMPVPSWLEALSMPLCAIFNRNAVGTTGMAEKPSAGPYAPFAEQRCGVLKEAIRH